MPRTIGRKGEAGDWGCAIGRGAIDVVGGEEFGVGEGVVKTWLGTLLTLKHPANAVAESPATVPLYSTPESLFEKLETSIR